jgi:adenylosuccinate synthase
MTDIETSMVEEMKSLIKDQAIKINDQCAYIMELHQQMNDMHDRYYDC